MIGTVVARVVGMDVNSYINSRPSGVCRVRVMGKNEFATALIMKNPYDFKIANDCMMRNKLVTFYAIFAEINQRVSKAVEYKSFNEYVPE